jgi:hypothetical protein
VLTLSNADIIPILQTAIGPVILVSGVGLFLLTMTNRLGRTIDRARAMVDEGAGPGRQGDQLAILWSRARLLRWAILLASASVLCAALLVILLFLAALMKIELAWGIAGLFIVGMLLLIGALVLFIREVNQSLGALGLELGK